MQIGLCNFCANQKQFAKADCTVFSELCSLLAESKSCALDAHDIAKNIFHRENILKASDGLTTDCWKPVADFAFGKSSDSKFSALSCLGKDDRGERPVTPKHYATANASVGYNANSIMIDVNA